MPIRLPFHQAEKNFELRKEQNQKKKRRETEKSFGTTVTREVSVVIEEGLKSEEKLILETTLVSEFVKAESKEEMEEKVTEKMTEALAELKNMWFGHGPLSKVGIVYNWRITMCLGRA